MNQKHEVDFVTLVKEDVQKEYHTIDKNYIIINGLTNRQTDSKISLLLLIILLFVGGISMYTGNVFSSFVAVIWVYLFNVFYSHFNIFPDPLVNVHSSKNFIISNGVFGKNNQLYAMHFNSFVKSAIAQASIFVLAFADYFLYSFRNKITILYNIDFKPDKTPEIEFVATSTLLLIIVLIFNVRNMLQVASATRHLGYSLYLNNIIFYYMGKSKVFSKNSEEYKNIIEINYARNKEKLSPLKLSMMDNNLKKEGFVLEYVYENKNSIYFF